MSLKQWKMLVGRAVAPVALACFMGCGTTRVSDTTRTGTEQLLVSNSIDQSVSQLDFSAMAGKPVFFDPQYLEGVTDKGYLISSIRQHILACGCLLQEDRAKATYVVEARAGSVGTDRTDLLFGVPQMNVPTIIPGQPGGLIPEIPVVKRTNHKGVAKIAVFAYNRTSGRPVWQSGTLQAASTSKDLWLFGGGPFQSGTIRQGTELGGAPLQIPLLDGGPPEEAVVMNPAIVPVTQAAVWEEPAGSNRAVVNQGTLPPVDPPPPANVVVPVSSPPPMVRPVPPTP